MTVVVSVLFGLLFVSLVLVILSSMAINEFLKTNNLPLMDGFMNLKPMLQAYELEKAIIFDKIDESKKEEAEKLLSRYKWAVAGIVISILGLVAYTIQIQA